MNAHLQKEVAKLKTKILALTEVVENAVNKSVAAIGARDAKLAQEVIDGDANIDHAEVDIEEDCLKILALYQPVATDLRFVVAVLKINSDIERVGDLAVNLAERALFLCGREQIGIPFDFADMCTKALAMLRQSLDALLKMDADMAHKVRASDDEVDDINRQMYRKVGEAVRKTPEHVDILLCYLSASRHLERIADYATNIAEDVVYLIEGQIVRHKSTLPET